MNKPGLIQNIKITPTPINDNVYHLKEKFHVFNFEFINYPIEIIIGGYDYTIVKNYLYQKYNIHMDTQHFSPKENMRIKIWLSKDYDGLEVISSSLQNNFWDVKWDGLKLIIKEYDFVEPKHNLYTVKPGNYFIQIENTVDDPNIYYKLQVI